MAKYKISDIFRGNFPAGQLYGENPANYAQFGLKGHEGVDYLTPPGIKILNPFERGVILRDNDDFKNNAYGNFVVIWDRAQRIAVWYAHLSKNNVIINQEFDRGAELGDTGNSGNSSGPHLHVNFCETDDKGNRLNMKNGFQGFLNILDPNLVEWIPINSSPTTPMPTESERKKSIQVDQSLNYLKSKGYISDDDSNHYLDGQFFTLIKKLYEDYESQKGRAGKWDKLCLKGGITSDSNLVTVDQLYNAIHTDNTDELAKALKECQEKNVLLTKKLQDIAKIANN